MRKAMVLLAVLALLVIGVAAPAGARPDARPFKAQFEGDVYWSLDSGCPFTGVRTSSEATGNASHMGKTTMTSSHCTPPGLEYGPGEMILMAANGDEVTLVYSGVCDPYLELPVGEILTCTMDFEIVSGTGRFSDASGSGTGAVSMIWAGIGVPTTPAWWTQQGTIGY